MASLYTTTDKLRGLLERFASQNSHATRMESASTEPQQWGPDKLMWRMWSAVRQAKELGEMNNGGPYALIHGYHVVRKKQSQSDLSSFWYAFSEPHARGYRASGCSCI